MEPPPKRLRLFKPDASNYGDEYEESYDSYDEYDNEETTLDADEGIEEEEVDYGENIDPELVLQQKRAQLDYKLKSKFEAIFEKYGRDFTGIGDEIDLKTGEIVVNNGHLLEMQDERDAGTSRQSLLRAFTVEPEERLGAIETEAVESDDMDESHVALEDMEEDDMILFEGSGSVPKRPQTPLLPRSPPEQQDESDAISTNPGAYPSESEILAQFGDQLGPQIAKYVSQQRVLNSTSIEPAWRTPGLPLATPGNRPILKSILLQPEVDRSPSPKGSSSVWAPKKPRGRPRKDGADVAAIFRGETIVRDRTWYSSGYVSTTVTKQLTERADLSRSERRTSLPLKKTLDSGKRRQDYSENTKLKPSASGRLYENSTILGIEGEYSDEENDRSSRPYRSQSNPESRDAAANSGIELSNITVASQKQLSERSIDTSRSNFKPENKPKKARGPKTPFTKADDEALIRWVVEAQRKGYSLWSWTHWKLLAEQNPRHTFLSWLDHYRKQLYPQGIVDDAEPRSSKLHFRTKALDPPTQYRSETESCSKSEASPDSEESDQEIRQGGYSVEAGPLKSKNFQVRASHKRPIETIDLTIDEEPSELRLNASRLSKTPPPAANRVDGETSNRVVNCVNGTSGHEFASIHTEEASMPNLPPNSLSKSLDSITENRRTTYDEHIPVFASLENVNVNVASAQLLGRFSRNAFGSSYDFSDEEEEVDDGAAPTRIQDTVHLDVSNKQEAPMIARQLKEQIVNPSQSQQPEVGSALPLRTNSSSERSPKPSSLSKSHTPNRTKFTSRKFTLSGMLVIDDSEEFESSPGDQEVRSSQLDSHAPASGDEIEDLVEDPRKTPACLPIVQKSTPRSTTSYGGFRGRIGSSPFGPLVETPGGSLRRCGEKGYRCKKDFCFGCLDE